MILGYSAGRSVITRLFMHESRFQEGQSLLGRCDDTAEEAEVGVRRRLGGDMSQRMQCILEAGESQGNGLSPRAARGT